MEAIIAIIIISAAVLIGASIYFFNIAIVRNEKKFDINNLSEEEVRMWSEYSSLIKEGTAWIKAQNKERIEIKSHDGLRLVGHLLLAEKPKGTILMFHGYRSSGFNDFSCAAAYLYSLGYNLLIPDQRAHGESEGKYICFGVLERYDCLSWIEYINSRIGMDKPIILDGISMGAATVLMAAGLKLPDNVKGIIADCGFTSPWDIFSHIIKKDYHLPKFPLLYNTSFLSKIVAGFGFKDYSTLEALKSNKLPVLFAHGSKDTFVPSWMSEAAYKVAVSPKKLLIVPEALHGNCYMKDTDRYKKELKDFFDKYIETAF
ncbi:alpha/beta hydrolase [Alloiococcus sp. CFN-8]|uniref:alpha/beta hydrolase n=1 Tax=Alloiococcus sp. CFN-8 TaxID=3416081 RepID=UPI003CF35651